MIELVNHLAEAYAQRYSSQQDELLAEIDHYTRLHHPKAHMLSGQLQGKFLEMISRLIQPKRILEIGTFTGYSALCLARGLSPDGQLHTIENREADALKAQGFFQRSSYHSQINLHIGNALELIDELNETWDLVFIDADKTNYVNYFNQVFPKLKPNGVILADNVLFHGQVLEPEIRNKSARGVQDFNDHLLSRTDVDKLILTLRDGLMLIMKAGLR